MSYMVDRAFDGPGTDVSFLTGQDTEADKAEVRKARKAKLARMGIKPLDPYSSAMMDTVKPKFRGGNFRDTPRKRARAAGETFYLSDKPCHRGHHVRRFVSTGQCSKCLDIWTAERHRRS